MKLSYEILLVSCIYLYLLEQLTTWQTLQNHLKPRVHRRNKMTLLPERRGGACFNIRNVEVSAFCLVQCCLSRSYSKGGRMFSVRYQVKINCPCKDAISASLRIWLKLVSPLMLMIKCKTLFCIFAAALFALIWEANLWAGLRIKMYRIFSIGMSALDSTLWSIASLRAALDIIWFIWKPHFRMEYNCVARYDCGLIIFRSYTKIISLMNRYSLEANS